MSETFDSSGTSGRREAHAGVERAGRPVTIGSARQALLTELMFGVDSTRLAPGARAAPIRGARDEHASPSRTPSASERGAGERSAASFEGPGGVAHDAATAPRGTVAATAPSAPRDGGVRGPGTRVARLEALRLEHAAECPHCTASRTHTHVVFGEGDPEARLMFIGEAPGETEDRVGRPFVGRAGEKLDEIIRAMRLAREQVYIANVLKTRPPDNRTPLQHEVDACGPYLKRQIAIVRPEVIVTLGGPATKLVLGVEQGITRLRGVWASYRDDSAGELVEIPVMPTFHPAYLLRNYTLQTRSQVWDDMKQVLERLAAR